VPDGVEELWPWVTVTVTVVVDTVRVFVLLVRVVVALERRERGGAMVTVLDELELEQTRGMGARSQGPWGGPGSGACPAVVEACEDDAVSPAEVSPEVVSPALPDSVHEGAGRTGQSTRVRRPATSGVVVEAAARTPVAARVAAGAGLTVPSPPAVSTPRGTATATASGAHRRARARTAVHGSRGCTALSSREILVPRPARCRAACTCSHPRRWHVCAAPRCGKVAG
jgi:hypothetical protein